MRCLVLLFAIFGMAYCGSSREQYLDYNPLFGAPMGPGGPGVVQNHGAMGDPIGARNNAQANGQNSQGQFYDYPLYQGAPNTGVGPQVNQQHGYNGAPQVSGAGTGGSSGNNVQGNAQQASNTGGSSGSNNVGGQVLPNIIPSDDSRDTDYAGLNGYIPSQTGNGGQPGMVGGVPAQSNPGGYSGDVGATYYGANAAPVAGGADAGLTLQRQDLTQASGMSGAAMAGVVAGVVGVGAVGTAVAIVALKSAGSSSSPA